MLNESCVLFREDFHAESTDPHTLSCGACRHWAGRVAALRSCGLDLPLPGGIRSSLEGLALTGPPADSPIPQMELPEGLRARLRIIPSKEGRGYGPPRWLIQTRHVVAASYLLAVLAMAVSGGPAARERRAAMEISGEVTRAFGELGIRGGRTLSSLGGLACRGFKMTNDSVGTLLGRLGEHGENPRNGPSNDDEKEKPDGKRSTR